jgi:hypothetical protein
MFYAPYLTNSGLGSEGQAAGGPAFVAGEGTPFALIIVPVGAHKSVDHVAADTPKAAVFVTSDGARMLTGTVVNSAAGAAAD